MIDKRENLIENIQKELDYNPQAKYFENVIINNLNENDIDKIYELVELVKRNPYYQAFLLYNLLEIQEKQKCGK